ncbi:SBBP repeat-containing protein, partial [Leptospira interrogans]
IAGVSTTAYGITSDSLGDLYSTGITSGNLDGQILTGTQDLFVLKYR